MALPTAAVVRANGIPQLGTSTTEDVNIATMITRADAVLAAWCGFPKVDQATDPTLEAATYTHYLNGPDQREARQLTLPVRPVVSITSIHDDTDRDWSYGAADLVASGDYTLDEVEGRVYLHSDSAHGYWRAGLRQIKVIYSAGYATGTDVRITQGITALVAHWWQQRNTPGMTAVTLTDTTITALEPEIPAHVREIMWPVRLVEVGLG